MADITCDGCGACCWDMMGMPPFAVPPLVGLGAMDELPDDIGTELYYHHAGLVAGAASRDARQLPCLWYSAVKRNCAHHEYRPQVCQDFEVGGDDCLRIRRAMGIDRGDDPQDELAFWKHVATSAAYLQRRLTEEEARGYFHGIAAEVCSDRMEIHLRRYDAFRALKQLSAVIGKDVLPVMGKGHVEART